MTVPPPQPQISRISVVIPTWNEEKEIAGCLASVPCSRGDVEVIVSDGDSSDSTVRLARAAGARVVTGPRGRGHQLARGVAIARGTAILFLHADCRLAHGALENVRQSLDEHPSAPGGAFRMVIDAPGWTYRVIEAWSNWRLIATRMACGDQAQFVRRSALDRIGGVPDQEFMEDIELSLRLRRHGFPVVVHHPAVLVSARRWQHEGMVYGTLRNWIISMAYLAGVPARRLLWLYPGRPVPGDLH